MPPLLLGTRNSALARWQANWVAARLTEAGCDVELVPIATQGDVVQQGPIGAIGTSGVFTKELQKALIEKRIDLAVHSLKDLPTDKVEGLALTSVPERASPFDTLVSREGRRFAELPPGAVIGTGSLRRRAQLLHRRPDLQMLDVRGNVDTRLRKLREGQYDALVLAEAGLTRLDLAAEITEVLPADLMLPAIGQGALGIEARSDDRVTRDALAVLDHAATHQSVVAERSLLAALRGGCMAPVGAWARLSEAGSLHLDAVVLSFDGKQRIAASATGEPADAAQLGHNIAGQLLAEGAGELIQASRGK